MKKFICLFWIQFFAVSFLYGQCTVVIQGHNLLCFGDNSGSAKAVVSGVAPYSYHWSNGDSTQIIENLSAGVYSVTATDAIGCISVKSVTIAQPTKLTVQASHSGFGTCSGEAYAITSANGGTPGYKYCLNGCKTSGIFTYLQNGKYPVDAIDQHGCIASTSVTIYHPKCNKEHEIDTYPTCAGSCNGASWFQVVSFDYYEPTYWSNGDYGSTATNLCPGPISVDVLVYPEGENYSYWETYSGYVDSISEPQVEIFGDVSICGNKMATLTAKMCCGTPPYLYRWNQGISADSTINVSPETSTVYTVTVTDAQGKITSDNFLVTVNQHCGNTISGFVFYDKNMNGIQDLNEEGVAGKMIKITPGPSYATTNSNGFYISRQAGVGNYIITIPNPGYYSVLSDTNNATFSNLGQIDAQNNFALQYRSVNDLRINMSCGAARPGFDFPVYLSCKNNGTDTADIFVKLKYDSILVYQTSTGTYYTGDSIIWFVQNLAPNQTRNLQVEFKIPVNTTFGRIIKLDAMIYPISGDTIPSDNSFQLQRTVTGSYDPNDKSVIPNTYMTSQQLIDKIPFIYTIRFQNTGTDTAFNIAIIDTLDQNLDVSTFEMIASNYQYSLTILKQNILKWTFNNILLPDSNTNEVSSHGFIQYQIKPKNNLSPNENVFNTAHIFFDFNQVVSTNKTNVVVSPLFTFNNSVSICQDQTYSIGTHEYNTTGIYYDTLQTFNGCCDSLIITNLTVLQPVLINLQASICAGDSVFLGGNWQKTSGIYYDTLQSTFNCDSIVITNLTINSNPTVSSSATNILCNGNFVNVTVIGTGGTAPYSGVGTFSVSAGTYNYIVTDSNNCMANTSIVVTWAGPCDTKVRASDCGITISNLNQAIYCNTVNGASNYEWEFTSSDFSCTRIKGNGNPGFRVSWITGIEYDKTYNVRVRAFKNGIWGNFSTVCQITTCPFPTTNLRTDFCGTTIPSMNMYIYCEKIPRAIDYEWEFINIESSYSFTKIRGVGSPSMLLSWITGLEYNKTYNVRIRAKVGSQWSSFGQVCQITTPNIPNTKLRGIDCGITLTSFFKYFYCDQINKATDYEWEFVESISGITIIKNRGSNSHSMNLNLANIIQNSKTYNVRVRAKIGNQWGSFGSVCQITTPIPNVQKSNQNGENDLFVKQLNNGVSNIELAISPNPVGKENSFNLTMKSDYKINDCKINIYNIIGQVVFSKQFNIDVNNYSINIEQNEKFSSGLFIIRFEFNNEIRSLKMIVE